MRNILLDYDFPYGKKTSQYTEPSLMEVFCHERGAIKIEDSVEFRK